MRASGLAVLAAVFVLCCVEGMPWGQRAVNPPAGAELDGGMIAAPIYTMDGDGARAVVGDDDEDNNDLGETDGESATAQITQRAQADAKSVVRKADNVDKSLENLMGDLEDVRKGHHAATKPAIEEMMALPDELQHNDMEQDISNIKNDAKNIASRIAEGKVRLGADAVRRAQQAHRSVETEEEGMKSKVEGLLGRQAEAMEDVKHLQHLASQVKADIRQHEDDIPNLGEVDGVETAELPDWAAKDKAMMGQMRDDLTRVKRTELNAAKTAALTLQSAGTVEELGEEQEDNSHPKFDFEATPDETTDVNAAQRSMFEDP